MAGSMVEPVRVAGCLLLVAAALVVWPVPAIRGGWRRPPGLRWIARSKPAVLAHRGTAVLAAIVILLPVTAMAGPSGALAASMLLVTGRVLIGRMLADRRRRRALPEILRGLRTLERELRSGADPLTAARGAAGACRGPGKDVLDALVALMRSGDDGIDPTFPAGEPGRDSSRDALDFLRSAWLLSRRHGVAFGGLVAGIAEDMTDRLAAVQARSGQLAGPRMSGYVMAALPLMGLLLGAGMGVNPVVVLVVSPLGHLLLVVGVALMCGGLLWSARIVGR